VQIETSDAQWYFIPTRPSRDPLGDHDGDNVAPLRADRDNRERLRPSSRGAPWLPDYRRIHAVSNSPLRRPGRFHRSSAGRAKQRPAAHAMFECGGGWRKRQRNSLRSSRETSEPTSTPSLRGALATKQSTGVGNVRRQRTANGSALAPGLIPVSLAVAIVDRRRFVRWGRPEADRSFKVRIKVAPLRVHCLDQGHLLGARAALDLLLARDRFILAFIGLVCQAHGGHGRFIVGHAARWELSIVAQKPLHREPPQLNSTISKWFRAASAASSSWAMRSS
jgi:hypothetical protein